MVQESKCEVRKIVSLSKNGRKFIHLLNGFHEICYIVNLQNSEVPQVLSQA